MKKRISVAALVVCLLLTMLPFGAFAEETADPTAKSGTCGEGLSWVLDGYTLTVSGSGEMADGAPWEAHKDHIEHVVFTGGVTRIGAEAFYKYDRIETVDFGDALVEIGEKAFYGCEDIVYIHLPKTFRKFGAECFRECTGLQRVYCDGGMPRFESSCLWTGNYISIFCPTTNPWPGEYTTPLVSSYGGKLGMMMGNFDRRTVETELGLESAEPAEAPQETPKETEAAVEETVSVQTEPAQAAPVETKPAAVPTVPAEEEEREVVWITAAATEPEEVTEPAEEEAAAAEPEVTIPLLPMTTQKAEDVAKQLEGKSWIGIVMIVGVLIFLIAGAVIFHSASRRNSGRRNGRYRR